jgi:hypothetical protein
VLWRAAVRRFAASLACTCAKTSSDTRGGTGTPIQSSGGRGAWLAPGPTGRSADLRARAGVARVRLPTASPV